jgi:hypothetical protein
MFGSNFDSNFGIPQQPQQQFPYQGSDSQGGLLGPNAAPDSFSDPGSVAQQPTAPPAAGSPPAASLSLAAPTGGPMLQTPPSQVTIPLANPLAPGTAPSSQPQQGPASQPTGISSTGAPYGKGMP